MVLVSSDKNVEYRMQNNDRQFNSSFILCILEQWHIEKIHVNQVQFAST